GEGGHDGDGTGGSGPPEGLEPVRRPAAATPTRHGPRRRPRAPGARRAHRRPRCRVTQGVLGHPRGTAEPGDRDPPHHPHRGGGRRPRRPDRRAAQRTGGRRGHALRVATHPAGPSSDGADLGAGRGAAGGRRRGERHRQRRGGGHRRHDRRARRSHDARAGPDDERPGGCHGPAGRRVDRSDERDEGDGGMRAMWLEIRDELVGILREPTALFFSVLMPVGFFTFFVAMFGEAWENAGTAMIVPFGTFGVLAVVLMNPGIGMADARQRGWLRVKRVSGIPLWMTIAAKVIASIPYAVAVLAAITASAVFVGDMRFDAGEVAVVFAVLVLGVLPFAFFSVAIGSRVGAN